MPRLNGRSSNQIREIKVTKNYIIHPHGSVLFQMGSTRVLCSASVENKVPSFLRDKGQGWVTAEYSMLPSSTHTRTPREASRGKLSGRTQEIQRLIGRSLRSIVDLEKLGERTVWIDCDVIQADGGTRCASITGSFIALVLAMKKLKKDKIIDAGYEFFSPAHIAEKWEKYVKIKGFDTLIKIESLVLTGNDFRTLRP